MTMRHPIYASAVLFSLLGLACAGNSRDDSFSGGAGVTAGDSGGGDPSGTGDGPGSTDTDGGEAGTGPDTGDSGDAPKFDVMPADDGEGGCTDPDGDCGCTAVDVLFVVDNSASMSSAQAALSQAFPQFADAMVEALPPATSLHVGVTSTEMGYTNGGGVSGCYGNYNGQPSADFYVTPDQNDSGRNGAQGRLYVTDGQPFFAVDTDDAAGMAELETWFAAAATIGEGGSQIEMSTAAAGWVADPVNDPTNAGFIRDAGAVLVVFFLQDEPDQSPGDLGSAMLQKLADRKAACGGASCIIGGGMINESCVDDTAMGDFLAGLGAPAVTAPFPNGWGGGGPQAADFVALLEDTLAGVIAQKCDEIPPEG